MNTTRWFWLVVVGVEIAAWLMLTRAFRRRASWLRLHSHDVGTLRRGAVVLVGGSTAMAAAIQLSAGWADPRCFMMQPAGDASATAFAALIACASASVLVWLHRSGGADVLARVYRGLRRSSAGIDPAARTIRQAGIVAAAMGVLLGVSVVLGPVVSRHPSVVSPGCGAVAAVPFPADPARWRVVYDAREHALPVPWVFLVLFLLPIALWARHDPATADRRSRTGMWLATVFLVSVVPFAIVMIHGEEAAVRAALVSGRYTLVTGEVYSYEADPGQGYPYRSAADRFTVDDHRFSINGSSAGFHQVAGDGSPIREGLRVRIAAVSGDIARLEIANDYVELPVPDTLPTVYASPAVPDTLPTVYAPPAPPATGPAGTP